MKSLIIVHSYHHNNTLKVAKAMGKILGAEVMNTEQAEGIDLREYDLVGFGAGIDSGMHYKELLDYAQTISLDGRKKKCFVFSTSAVQGERKVAKDHEKLRRILKIKGYFVLGEFSCKGFNTNVFLKYFGGMNRQHPTPEDIDNAKRFATGMQRDMKAVG